MTGDQKRKPLSKMQSQGCKNWLFWILLTFSSGNFCCIKVDATEAVNRKIYVHQFELADPATKRFEDLAILHSQLPSNLTQPILTITQASPGQTESNDDAQKQKAPQLEVQPNNFPTSSPNSIEQILNTPQNSNAERIERLRQLLQEKKQPPPQSANHQELGLRVRPRPLEQQPIPPTEQSVPKFKPIGYIQAYIGYFQTTNIFSAKESPIGEGLYYSGLTLSSAYFPLAKNTYLNGSINGNLIRYINQTQYHNNQVKFNLNLYQQLSRQMYGEISWSNQQLFYANNSDRADGFKAGDRFLNESSWQLSLGRRDPLTPKLTLNSFYELSINFADPQSRNRVINSFWVSLNYYLQKPLQVGIDYQFDYSDFTQREREDQFHRLFGHLNYRISNSTNMNVQAGATFGSSTDQSIDFDGWFFSINYNLELGRF